ncbi:MAG TPA: NAD(P)-dependent oxidoreductase, partial [Polyangiaceae bacterium]
GFDRAPARKKGEHVQGELSDRSALDLAMRDVDVVVHLAATADRADFLSDLLPNNVVGTYNVYEAAVANRVRRVVYASSARVASGVRLEGAPLSAAHGLSPMDFYALTKCCGELMGQIYERRGQLSVICARIGWYLRNRGEAEKLAASEWGRRVYLSHRDAVLFFRCAVEAPNVPFSQLFVSSRNDGASAFDIAAAKDAIGFVPIDSFPHGSSFDKMPEFPSPTSRAPSSPAPRGKR